VLIESGIHNPSSEQVDEKIRSMRAYGTSEYTMPQKNKISAIMLGSQASATTVDYIDEMAKVAIPKLIENTMIFSSCL